MYNLKDFLKDKNLYLRVTRTVDFYVLKRPKTEIFVFERQKFSSLKDKTSRLRWP